MNYLSFYIEELSSGIFKYILFENPAFPPLILLDMKSD